MNSFYRGTISSVYATNDLQKKYPDNIYDIIYETQWFYCVIKNRNIDKNIISRMRTMVNHWFFRQYGLLRRKQYVNISLDAANILVSVMCYLFFRHRNYKVYLCRNADRIDKHSSFNVKLKLNPWFPANLIDRVQIPNRPVNVSTIK